MEGSGEILGIHTQDVGDGEKRRAQKQDRDDDGYWTRERELRQRKWTREWREGDDQWRSGLIINVGQSM